MANNDRTECYIFRIYAISKKIVFDFQDAFPELEHQAADLGKIPVRKKPGKYTIAITLNKKNVNYSERIHDFVRKHRLSSKSYGVWVSLATARDSDGLTVPKIVGEFYKKVGGSLDFSFTSLSDG